MAQKTPAIFSPEQDQVDAILEQTIWREQSSESWEQHNEEHSVGPVTCMLCNKGRCCTNWLLSAAHPSPTHPAPRLALSGTWVPRCPSAFQYSFSDFTSIHFTQLTPKHKTVFTLELSISTSKRDGQPKTHFDFFPLTNNCYKWTPLREMRSTVWLSITHNP